MNLTVGRDKLIIIKRVTIKKSIWFRLIQTSIEKIINTRMKKIEILFCSILLLLLIILFGYHLLDNSVPAEDARAHIFKISMYYRYLQGNYTDWNMHWYTGMPFDDFYPPLFYLIGILINSVTNNIIVSYKLVFLFSMMLVGLGTYTMSRSILHLPPYLSFLSSFLFLIFPSVLKMYFYQTGPNFLALGSRCFLLV